MTCFRACMRSAPRLDETKITGLEKKTKAGKLKEKQSIESRYSLKNYIRNPTLFSRYGQLCDCNKNEERDEVVLQYEPTPVRSDAKRSK